MDLNGIIIVVDPEGNPGVPQEIEDLATSLFPEAEYQYLYRRNQDEPAALLVKSGPMPTYGYPAYVFGNIVDKNTTFYSHTGVEITVHMLTYLIHIPAEEWLEKWKDRGEGDAE